MSVKERLRYYISFKGISERKFCLTIGVSGTYINSIRKSMHPDKIKSIAMHFPDLNLEWLMTGIGEMIKDIDSKLESAKGTADNKDVVPAYIMEMLMKERETNDIIINKLLSQNQECLSQNKILISQHQFLIEAIQIELKEIRDIFLKMNLGNNEFR